MLNWASIAIIALLGSCWLTEVAATANLRPNIVLLLTDDQDIMLGSMEVMEKTKQTIIKQGTSFRNAFVTTPICCPSRSSILTGLYTHNHNVFTNNDNCSSPLWQRLYENGTFATYLNHSGYATGYFGKYLNEYNGSYTPPGWQYWMGLIKNSKYYNYTLLHNGVKERHGDNYHEDYLTDVVGNRSMNYFRDSKLRDPQKPVLTVLSFPAPHGPEDGAPQYQHLYGNVTSHQTKSFNYAPNPDKNWFLRSIPDKMDSDQYHFSSMLQQKRLQTLRSVDDNVKNFIDMLEETGELNNTYIIYMSDHGYHIGQYAIPKGKTLPYDFDTRIPFYFRGPNITADTSIDNVILNVDVAPTILDLAGIQVPSKMDGTSIMRLFRQQTDEVTPQWRDRFLIQRGKMPIVKITLHKPSSPYAKMKKSEHFQELCSLPAYSFPCALEQSWTCQNDTSDIPSGRLRVQKCKKEKGPRKKVKMCRCSPNERPQRSNNEWLDINQACRRKPKQRLEQRKYNRRHVQAAKMRAMQSLHDYRKRGLTQKYRQKRNAGKVNIERSMVLSSRCRMLMPNFEIKCSRDIYDDPIQYVKHMAQLAGNIQTMQFKLKHMKVLRNQLGDCGPKKIPGQQVQTPLCPCPVKPRTKIRHSSNSTHPFKTQTNDERRRYIEELNKFKEQKNIQKIITTQRKAKKQKKLTRPKKMVCSEEPSPKLKCFTMSKNSWPTEPRWDRDNKCYCTNSFNNTYWCLRILNERMNLMYCHFLNSQFEEFYDLFEDPDQLYNSVNELQSYERDWLHQELNRLRNCSGPDSCSGRGSDPPENASFLLKEQSQFHTQNTHVNPNPALGMPQSNRTTFVNPLTNFPKIPVILPSDNQQVDSFDIDPPIPQSTAPADTRQNNDERAPRQRHSSKRGRRKHSRKSKKRVEKLPPKTMEGSNRRKKKKKAATESFWSPPKRSHYG